MPEWKTLPSTNNKNRDIMNRVFEIEEEQLKAYLDMHLTYKEIAEKYNCSHWTVMKRAQEYGLKSEARKHQMIKDNPVAKEEVRKKISETIAKMWEDGQYAERINGMQGMTGEKNSNFLPEGSKVLYRAKAMHYHPVAECHCCGKKLSWDDKSLEVHHVDGDHNNLLLTNLKPLCHSCHKKYHRKSQYTVTITKSFVFDACHYLPYHDGKCKFMHGHTYHMDVSVKDKVLQETGMVMDFSLLNRIVKEEVIEKFDHGFLNEYIEYPTCEVMISWIWRQLSVRIKGLSSIKVWETDGSCCELTANDMTQYLRDFEGEWRKENNNEDEKD